LRMPIVPVFCQFWRLYAQLLNAGNLASGWSQLNIHV
jgi:hypothetical protein